MICTAEIKLSNKNIVKHNLDRSIYVKFLFNNLQLFLVQKYYNFSCPVSDRFANWGVRVKIKSQNFNICFAHGLVNAFPVDNWKMRS